jgi:hypothetical protein
VEAETDPAASDTEPETCPHCQAPTEPGEVGDIPISCVHWVRCSSGECWAEHGDLGVTDHGHYSTEYTVGAGIDYSGRVGGEVCIVQAIWVGRTDRSFLVTVLPAGEG